eukprot:jgi/Psemu1/264/gm1.264_g
MNIIQGYAETFTNLIKEHFLQYKWCSQHHVYISTRLNTSSKVTKPSTTQSNDTTSCLCVSPYAKNTNIKKNERHPGSNENSGN